MDTIKTINKIAYTVLLATAPFLGDYIVSPYMFIGGLILMSIELFQEKKYNIVALNMIGIIGWTVTILT